MPACAFVDDDGWFSRFASRHLNFFRLHLMYFATVGFSFAIIVYGIEQRNKRSSLTFIDAVFTAFSSSTPIHHAITIIVCDAYT